jgi:hypothetical protein
MKKILSLILVTFSFQALASLTISGISSGGFMAAQMGVIYSDQFSGVGLVAGGFYFCAQNHLQNKLKDASNLWIGDLSLYQTQFRAPKGLALQMFDLVGLSPHNPIYQAVGVCMQNPSEAILSYDVVSENQRKYLISAAENIEKQKIFIYQGDNDKVVNPGMKDSLLNFYRHYNVPAENIKISQSSGGHNFPTDHEGEKSCLLQEVPYVASCGLDTAGDTLRHLVSADLTRTENRESNLQFLNSVTQDIPRRLGIPRPKSIASYGYLAASPSCLQDPDSCSVHVALHGCEMSDSFDEAFDQKYQKSMRAGYPQMRTKEQSILFSPLPFIEQRTPRYGLLKFAMDSGYLDYVENNKLIVLFPQTWITEDNYPLNPKGCWDWFGWTGREYATNQGTEARWLMTWIQEIRKNPKAFIRSAQGLHIPEARALGGP